MSDIFHDPEPNDDGWACRDCGLEVPESLVLLSLGAGVIEAGGALFPADSTTMAVSCTHPSVTAQRKLSDECLSVAQCTTTRLRSRDDGIIGAQIILTPNSSQFEKQEPGLDPVRAAALGLTEGRISSF